MKDYIITLISVSIVCGIVHILTPAGVGDGIKKHVKLLTSLCVLCIMIAPVGGAIESLKEADFNVLGERVDAGENENIYDKIYNDTISTYSADHISKKSEEILCQKFSLEENDLDVAVSFSERENEISISKATVILYTGAVGKNTREISDCIKELLKCECEIIYK